MLLLPRGARSAPDCVPGPRVRRRCATSAGLGQRPRRRHARHGPAPRTKTSTAVTVDPAPRCAGLPEVRTSIRRRRPRHTRRPPRWPARRDLRERRQGRGDVGNGACRASASACMARTRVSAGTRVPVTTAAGAAGAARGARRPGSGMCRAAVRSRGPRGMSDSEPGAARRRAAPGPPRRHDSNEDAHARSHPSHTVGTPSPRRGRSLTTRHALRGRRACRTHRVGSLQRAGSKRRPRHAHTPRPNCATRGRPRGAPVPRRSPRHAAPAAAA